MVVKIQYHSPQSRNDTNSSTTAEIIQTLSNYIPEYSNNHYLESSVIYSSHGKFTFTILTTWNFNAPSLADQDKTEFDLATFSMMALIGFCHQEQKPTPPYCSHSATIK